VHPAPQEPAAGPARTRPEPAGEGPAVFIRKHGPVATRSRKRLERPRDVVRRRQIPGHDRVVVVRVRVPGVRAVAGGRRVGAELRPALLVQPDLLPQRVQVVKGLNHMNINPEVLLAARRRLDGVVGAERASTRGGVGAQERSQRTGRAGSRQEELLLRLGRPLWLGRPRRRRGGIVHRRSCGFGRGRLEVARGRHQRRCAAAAARSPDDWGRRQIHAPWRWPPGRGGCSAWLRLSVPSALRTAKSVPHVPCLCLSACSASCCGSDGRVVSLKLCDTALY
jgi:hypothetical protein